MQGCSFYRASAGLCMQSMILLWQICASFTLGIVSKWMEILSNSFQYLIRTLL